MARWIIHDQFYLVGCSMVDWSGVCIEEEGTKVHCWPSQEQQEEDDECSSPSITLVGDDAVEVALERGVNIQHWCD